MSGVWSYYIQSIEIYTKGRAEKETVYWNKLFLKQISDKQ